MAKLLQEEVIERFKNIHKDKYDYSKFQYIDSNSKGVIICKKHGEFLQSYASHYLSKYGCMKCAKEKQGKRQKLNTDHFIKKSKSVHGDRYNYSKSEYDGLNKKVKVICRKHGEFFILPGNHYKGKGCASCSRELKTFWTKERDNFLKNNYLKLGAKKCAKLLNKSKNSVSSRACIINASKPMTDYHPHIPSSVWGNLLESVKENDYDFDIDENFIYNLYLEQDKKCALSGLDIYFTKSKYEENTASIDRIDSNGGYTKNNVQIVHKSFNKLKLNFDQKEFLKMCELVYSHLGRRYSKIKLEEFPHLDCELPVRVFSEEPILEKDMHKDFSPESLFD